MREPIGNQGLMGDRIDTIRFRWHSPHCDDLRDLAERFVNVAHETLPEMLPTRYRRQATKRWMAFKRERRARFCNVTADNGDALWRSARPFHTGGIMPLMGVRGRPSPLVTTFAEVERIALENLDLRERTLRAFIDIAESLGCFYAWGLLRQRLLLGDDGKLYVGGRGAERSYAPHDKPFDWDGWEGLPWRNVVMDWFGPPYLPLLDDRIRAIGRPAGGGLLVEYTDVNERLDVLPTGLLMKSFEGGAAERIPPGLRYPPAGVVPSGND